jgi:hypothetical protein
MKKLVIGEKEYAIQFGYNCFCDTDLLDRVNDISRILNGKEVEDDSDVAGLGKIKDLFSVVRELMFVGFQKHNPVAEITDIGDLLDTYRSEAQEGEKRGLLSLFELLSEELVAEGFLADLFEDLGKATEQEVKKPKDHLKKVK